MPRPGVLDDDRGLGQQAHRHGDAGPRRAILERVVEEVVDRLGHQRGVDVRRWRARKPRRSRGRSRPPSPPAPTRARSRTRARTDRCAARFAPDCASGSARDSRRSWLARRVARCTAARSWSTASPHLLELSQCSACSACRLNAVERRAQLVRGVGDERAVGQRRGVELHDERVERLDQRLHLLRHVRRPGTADSWR